MTTHNPIDTARETLKQLTQRKLLPTPDNFERVYSEIMGIPVDARTNKLADLLLRAYESLPAEDASAKIAIAKLRRAIDDEKWELVPQLTLELADLNSRNRQLTQNWGSLLQDLMKAWELRNPALSQSYKQAALERVLLSFGNTPDELNEKLHNLVKSWLQPAAGQDEEQETGTARNNTETTVATPVHETNDGDRSQVWKDIFDYTLKFGIEPRLVHYPELSQHFSDTRTALASISSSHDIDNFFPQLRGFLIRLELQAQDDERLVTGLSNLMQLMLQNVAELNQSDSYLVGQISGLQQILAQPNISIQHIYQLEASLKEVIHKQGKLKHSLDEATSSLRALLDTFLDKLSLMSNSTGDFQQRLHSHSENIRSTRDVNQLNSILQSLLSDTADMQTNLSESHGELLAARNEVHSAQQRISELEQALEAASAKIKEDQLTGAYNRRGLEEHFEREISRAKRSGQPLSVALIDVDNFKQLNDRYGHLTGDDVLKYLVELMHRSMRSSDIVARFGGEEFVVLLPDTGISEAIELVQRLQRELTKNFFLANQDRLVVTFSAGVAQWHLGECDTDVIERADGAMYRAKLAGKNRTLSAETP
ncbi:diguanylate cyclase [Vogesella fluminis]|uniref:diguanylate cyclase n=1 Tax=Vogesella fluminis TaxID=1069161 RepID=A0ABQ3HAB1_9NEIS|nr:GGDEF domain-containing protein [Vogesella fluminis]GHD75644.1 hypothetical protein GCM10011419_13640 [Vogesella fluminis]